MNTLEKSLEYARNSSYGLDTSRSRSNEMDKTRSNNKVLIGQPFMIGNNPSLDSMTYEDPFVPQSPSIFGTALMNQKSFQLSPREKHYQLRQKHKKTDCERDAKANFYKNIRDCEVNYNISGKNPLRAIWGTDPTKRIDRSDKMKEYNFIKRSGFNKKIDAKNVIGVHKTPISPVDLKKKNLRKTATREFESLNLNQVSIDEQDDNSISSPSP